MPSVEIPFWLIVSREDVQSPPPHEPCDDPKAAHGFSTSEKLAAFMQSHVRAKWQIDQVADQEGVIVAVAQLYEQGYRDMCVDPEPDGSGGTLVSLKDLLRDYTR